MPAIQSGYVLMFCSLRLSPFDTQPSLGCRNKSGNDIGKHNAYFHPQGGGWGYCATFLKQRERPDDKNDREDKPGEISAGGADFFQGVRLMHAAAG